MYRFFPQKRVASCSIITRDIRKDLVLLHRLGSRVVPELEIMIVIHPSSTVVPKVTVFTGKPVD